MLHELVKYAETHGLDIEPGFQAKPVWWCLSFGANGSYNAVIPMTPDGKPKTLSRCPHFQGTSNKANISDFIVSTAEVVALYPPHSKGKDHASRKHSAYTKLLRDSASAYPVLAVIADQLDDEGVLQKINTDLGTIKKPGVRPTHRLTIEVDGRFLHEVLDIQNWWRHKHRELAGVQEPKRESGQRMRSLISGQLVEVALTHAPRIRGLSDEGRRDNALASFNSPAFTSYGLKQSANAAMSESEAAAYCTALNHMIEHSSVSLAGPVAVYWFKDRVEQDDNLFFLLENGDETEELQALRRARDLFASVQTGKRPDLGGNRFYSMILSGGNSRVTVREWMEGQFVDLVRNVIDWFDSLSITSSGGSDVARTPGIERIVECLLPLRKERQKYLDWVRPVGHERISLWRSALGGRPVPFSVLSRVVRHTQLDWTSGEYDRALHPQPSQDPRNTRIVISALHARMGLLKAYHMRLNRSHGKDPDMNAALNEDHPHPAYHCGRLLQILARLQYEALDRKLVTGLVQRYYGSASTTPALVFGRMLHIAQHHVAKLVGSDSKKGLGVWFEKTIAEISTRINEFPRTLSLEEQSLFALGYYQQMATRKSDTNQDTTEAANG